MSEECICGLTYHRFRTGLCYQDVFLQLWVDSSDPTLWVYKRRHTVLGRWRQIKQEMWRSHCAECEHYYQQDPEGFQEWLSEQSKCGETK